MLDFNDRTTCVLFATAQAQWSWKASDAPGILASSCMPMANTASLCTPGTVSGGWAILCSRWTARAVFAFGSGRPEDAARAELLAKGGSDGCGHRDH